MFFKHLLSSYIQVRILEMLLPAPVFILFARFIQWLLLSYLIPIFSIMIVPALTYIFYNPFPAMGVDMNTWWFGQGIPGDAIARAYLHISPEILRVSYIMHIFDFMLGMISATFGFSYDLFYNGHWIAGSISVLYQVFLAIIILGNLMQDMYDWLVYT